MELQTICRVLLGDSGAVWSDADGNSAPGYVNGLSTAAVHSLGHANIAAQATDETSLQGGNKRAGVRAHNEADSDSEAPLSSAADAHVAKRQQSQKMDHAHYEHTWAAIFDAECNTERFEAACLLCEAFGIKPLGSYAWAGASVRVDEPHGAVELFCNTLGNAEQALAECEGDLETIRLIIHAPSELRAGGPGSKAVAEFFVSDLHSADYMPNSGSMLSVSFVGDDTAPCHYHYRLSNYAWNELVTCRNINPLLVDQWEMGRFDKFTAVKQVAYSEPKVPMATETSKLQRKTDYRIGAFLAEEGALYGKNNRDRRVFLRAAVYSADMLLIAGSGDGLASQPMRTVSGLLQDFQDQDASLHRQPVHRVGVPSEDSVLADILGNLELSVGREKTAWNHVFMRMIPFEGGLQQQMDEDDIEDLRQSIYEVLEAFLRHCLQDLQRLRVECVEVKVGSVRLLATNPTGYRFKIDIVHEEQERGGQPQPYALLDSIQRKRMVAHSLGSTYVYDMEAVLADLAKQRWFNLHEKVC